MSTKGYYAIAVEGQAKGCHAFHGPGMPRHVNRVVVAWPEQAENVARLLAKAYEAGRQDKAAEVRAVLGVREK